MRNIDYDNAVPITREIYWIGFYDKEAKLHCNPYLFFDEEDTVLFDPGSIPHFPIVMRKVIELINPSEITFIIASHQDPDVCGNLAVVEDVINRTDLKIAAHINSIRLMRHYGINSEFYDVQAHDFKLTLKSGKILEFLFTPYLHSPGAIMTYDRDSRSLFTSDLFGGISKEWSLFAKNDFLQSLEVFHKLYMPSNQVLRNCMERLIEFEIDRILPQHGSIIEGSKVKTAIEHLKTLPCGVDLIRS